MTRSRIISSVAALAIVLCLCAGVAAQEIVATASTPLAVYRAGHMARWDIEVRGPGWPMWYWATQGKDEAKVRAASRYYDVVNFAPRVTAPILIGLGLVDTVCPAPGVFAMANALKGPKEVVVMPLAGHGGDHGAYQRRAEAWSAALLKGTSPPISGTP